MMPVPRLLAFISLFICLIACQSENKPYRILGNIEDPQNEIAYTIASVLNQNLADSIQVLAGVGSLANLDSLEMGKADFGIIDNYSRFSDQVHVVLPLYPQVLHILHKRTIQPTSFRDLFTQRKIYAGQIGSGTRQFINQILQDLNINTDAIQWVSVYELFDADVIISFTDLLSHEELRDLKEYKLFSIDNINTLGKGSIAEGICTRHPQFQPFVIARDLYGNFTEAPILTLKVDALLVCRANLEEAFIYSVVETLMENRQDMRNINPLLFDFSMDFNASKLNFVIHRGTRSFLERHEPTFLEKYAELFSVIISIFVMLASSLYTISRWSKARKKNKLDNYYQNIVTVRSKIPSLATKHEAAVLLAEIKTIQDDAMRLVMKEKLMADESFTIFLNLSKMVLEEVKEKHLTWQMPTSLNDK
jgi:TRAP-type uncharacterized transport system substrate-binding protein